MLLPKRLKIYIYRIYLWAHLCSIGSTVSSFTRTLVMIHMPEMMFQMLLFLPRWTTWSVVQQNTSSTHYQKDSSHLPLLIWILLAPGLFTPTTMRMLEKDRPAGACQLFNAERTWELPVLTASSWLFSWSEVAGGFNVLIPNLLTERFWYSVVIWFRSVIQQYAKITIQAWDSNCNI